VRLEPLSLAHVPALEAVALDPSLWELTTTRIATTADVERYVRDALAELQAARSVPFATVERASGRVVGSTRFAAIEPVHRRVEIGWTWVAAPWQRTVVNTEAKRLMLAHAFDTWGCVRVELKTGTRNLRSRRAILRLGAVEEGVLRRHLRMPDGSWRDTVYYSVIDTEWPAVRARLDQLLAGGGVE